LTAFGNHSRAKAFQAGERVTPAEQTQQPPSNGSEIQHCATESLIDCGQLDLANWCERLRCERPAALERKQSASAGETALWILPIALYFHDHRESLYDRVRQAAALWLHPQENVDEVLMWASAIAWILREAPIGDGFLDRLLTTVEDPSTPMFRQLERLRTLRDRAVPLEAMLEGSHTGHSPTPPTPLARAFYCFASTPEDFSLCVKRAARAANAPQAVAALTGVLAGLYNSSCGIPPRWRTHPQAVRVNQQAEQLFASWSGVYQPHRQPVLTQAIAAAGAIQPRASLKIISHHPG
jgi:ADP-ribosylglycohydrolase